MPVDQPAYPVNLLLEGQPVLVVGAGAVALSKVDGLLEAGAVVHVIAPEIDAALRSRPVTFDEREYRSGDAGAPYRLVLATTDDAATNQQVFDDATRAGIFVNSADDPERCTFTLPARIRRGPLLVTVSTGGQSPAVSRWLRRQLESELGPEHETLVTLVGEAREEIRRSGRSTMGLDWQSALDSGMLDLIRAGRIAEARERLQACLSSSSD